MNLRERWLAWTQIPAVRTGLFVLGLLLIASTPAVGILPGPGGVIVFGAGLGLVLKYSEWAKRQYVRFKRKHPNKGRWADWGLRRESARRREELRRRRETELSASVEIERVERSDGRAVLILYEDKSGVVRYVIERCFAPKGEFEHESYWAPVAISPVYEDVEAARVGGIREMEGV